MKRIVRREMWLAAEPAALADWLKTRQPARLLSEPDADSPAAPVERTLELRTPQGRPLVRISLSQTGEGATLVTAEAAAESEVLTLFVRLWTDMMATFSQPPTPPAAPTRNRNRNVKHKPQAMTLFKLYELRERRKRSIRGGRVTLGWTAACRLSEIDPKTAKRHAPALHAHWYDPDY